MRLKFIHWKAPCNRTQEVWGEKYSHYALLLGPTATDTDKCIVWYFDHKKEMTFACISKEKTNFVELAEVEVPGAICGIAKRYLADGKNLQEFSDTFLAYVDQYREPIDEADDRRRMAELDKLPPDERLLAGLGGSNHVEQPFPRKPKP